MAKYKAQGFKLYKDDGASGLTKPVIQLITIDPQGSSTTQIDVTDHDSTGAEFLGGVVNAGEFQMEIHWDPKNAVHDELVQAAEAGTSATYQLHFPSHITAVNPWEFAATITSFSPGMPADGALTATVTFQVSGSIDRNATAWT